MNNNGLQYSKPRCNNLNTSYSIFKQKLSEVVNKEYELLLIVGTVFVPAFTTTKGNISRC